MTSPEEQLQALIAEQKSLQIASLTPESLPYASYTPFIYLNGSFYIYISELAKHTQNLKENTAISILIIEDEVESKQIFARKRLSGEGYVTEVKRAEEAYTHLVEVFTERFGNIMHVIANLSDFRLFEVKIDAGIFVMGFGKAYTFSQGDVTKLIHQSTV